MNLGAIFFRIQSIKKHGWNIYQHTLGIKDDLREIREALSNKRDLVPRDSYEYGDSGIGEEADEYLKSFNN